MPDSHWQAWTKLVSSHDEFDSPFFRPELTRAVAAVRDDVELAVALNDDEPVAFFPFQRRGRNACQPVTGRLSEFHGVVAKPDASWSPPELMRGARLRGWHFDHLPATQTQFQPYVWGHSESPYIDLSKGYDQYRDTLKRSGSSLSQVERKRRKMAREVGELRFEVHADDDAAFELLRQWKTEQHARTGVLQIFTIDWVNRLLDDLRHCHSPEWAGVFSVLYAAGEPVAVHLGIRSRNALHIWFPAYNVAFEKYSPGLILLLDLARESAALGIERIDMGRGEERYKTNFKSADIMIAEGMIDELRANARARKAWYDVKRRIRNSGWRRQLELPLLATRRFRQWIQFS
ncbi:MAG: GNAT family N-acetyltransferase [Pseudomonadota bacterium]